jgi:hypothetical protein
MKEKKHTPGPWKTQTHISLDRLEIRDADGRRIAECAMDFPMSAKTHDANARLIAAAPELLAALESICTEISGGLCMNYTGATGICPNAAKGQCAVWDAIQKAKGTIK